MADALMRVSQFDSNGLDEFARWFWGTFNSHKRNKGTPLAYLNGDASSMVGVEGDIVKIPLAPTISSNLLTDGNAVTKDDSVGSETTITLNRHRYTTWGWTQMAQTLGNGLQAENQARARIVGLLNDVEEDILSMITTGLTSNTAGTSATAITEAVVVEAVADIMANKPADNVLTGLLAPDLKAWGALAQLARFTDYDVRGTQNNLTGEGSNVAPRFTAYGVNWNVCHALPLATTRYNVVFDRNALCYAMRSFVAPMSPGVYTSNFAEDGVAMQLVISFDKDRLADQLTLHTLYGYGVGREEWGCLLLS